MWRAIGAARVLYRSIAQPNTNDGNTTDTAQSGGCENKCKPAKTRLVSRLAIVIGEEAIFAGYFCRIAGNKLARKIHSSRIG